MSHDDFAAYMGRGRNLAGYSVNLVRGFDALHMLELDGSAELPLVFDGNEGLEARIERLVAAVERWAVSQHPVAA